MMYRHVFLTASAIQAIQDETRQTVWVETGGAFAGYVSAENALVVTHASGPGPRAIRRPWSITVDGAYTTAYCNQIYDASDGRLDYIGDWHLHLGWSTAYSNGDLDAMRTIAASGACAAPSPVSLIYSRRLDALVVYGYPDGKLTPINASSIPGIPA